jgi:cysteine desulfurase
MNDPITAYLDCNATTPLAARVREVMEPWLGGQFGNASSRDHKLGWAASEAVERSRSAVAAAVGFGGGEVMFMSGATEALNTVLRSYVGYGNCGSKKLVICATEHAAVLTTSVFLCEKTGVDLEILPVDRLGHVSIEGLSAVLEGTRGALVAIMAANHEIGTVHKVGMISEIVHAANGLLLCDTTQAIGKCTLEFWADKMDYSVVSAHKIYGPKGAGALLSYSDESTSRLEPLILGGGQERGRRGGTCNIPGIVGLSEACRLVTECRESDAQRVSSLRDRLEDGILTQLSDTWINGDRAARLCNTSNIGFMDIDARALIRDMHDIAVSTRSACSSGDTGPSHVLKAIGLSDEDASSCIRFSLGRFTTDTEIDYAIEKVVGSVHKLRRLKSLRV